MKNEIDFHPGGSGKLNHRLNNKPIESARW